MRGGASNRSMTGRVVHLKGRVAEMLVHLSTMSVGRAAPTGKRATALTVTALRLRPTQGIDPPTMKVILRMDPPPIGLPRRPDVLLPLVARNAWRSQAIVLTGRGSYLPLNLNFEDALERVRGSAQKTEKRVDQR